MTAYLYRELLLKFFNYVTDLYFWCCISVVKNTHRTPLYDPSFIFKKNKNVYIHEENVEKISNQCLLLVISGKWNHEWFLVSSL